MLIVLVIVQVRFFQMRPRYLPDASHLIPIALSSPPPQRTKTIVWGRALVLSLCLFSVWARAPKACGVRRTFAKACHLLHVPLARFVVTLWPAR